jgi:NAD(P)-dependent dehydrogenase (short-subunit alcohol dehydrogenase family)
MAGRLHGRVSVVTGSGRGIGKALALALASEGTSVVVNDLGGDDAGRSQSNSTADEVVREIKESGGKAVANYDDVSSFSGAARIIGAAVDHFGRLDVLIANAGIERRGYLYEIAEEDWDRVMGVIAKGTFNCLRHAAPIMKEQNSGTIISIMSGAAFSGTARLGAYSAAKGAIYSLMLVAASELRPHNVTVNCISPGFTRTRLGEGFLEDLKKAHGLTDQQVEAMLASFGGAQPPQNVAPLAVFLCTEEGRKTTGQAFEVAGDRISVFSSPGRPATVFKPGGGWMTEDLLSIIPRSLASLSQAPAG